MYQARALFYSLFASCCFVLPSAAQEASPKELGEVKVRGARDPDLQAQQESTSTKIIYGRDKLDKTADSTVAEFIKRLPGVTVSGTPGAGGSVRMLGLGGGRDANSDRRRTHCRQCAKPPAAVGPHPARLGRAD